VFGREHLGEELVVFDRVHLGVLLVLVNEIGVGVGRVGVGACAALAEYLFARLGLGTGLVLGIGFDVGCGHVQSKD